MGGTSLTIESKLVVFEALQFVKKKRRIIILVYFFIRLISYWVEFFQSDRKKNPIFFVYVSLNQTIAQFLG